MSQKKESSLEKVKVELQNPVSGDEKVDRDDKWSDHSDRSLSYKDKFVGLVHDYYDEYE